MGDEFIMSQSCADGALPVLKQTPAPSAPGLPPGITRGELSDIQYGRGGQPKQPLVTARARLQRDLDNNWISNPATADAVRALLVAPPTLPGRYHLGELIYRAMYEHQGGKWEANETPDVWFEAADRLRAMLADAARSASPRQVQEQVPGTNSNPDPLP